MQGGNAPQQNIFFSGEPMLTKKVRFHRQPWFNTRVMEIMSYLTDVYGPRLTNSPDIKEAAAWTTGKMKEWQLANVHLEPWGPFGRGWSNERFCAQVISPRPFPLIAYPKAWTPGTNGP